MAARWINGSRAMVSVNSIFAGFSGGLLVAIYRQPDSDPTITQLGSVLAMVAMLAFAVAAERVTDALDEGKVSIYVWSMQFHNAGVIAVLASLATFLYMNHWSFPYNLLPVLASAYWAWHFMQLLSREYRTDYIALISAPE